MSVGGVEFVRLTGQPRAKLASDEIPFVPDKRFQLLTYLAFDSGWVGRERAAFLFWPDAGTENSRSNLRGLLQRLRTLPFEPGIEANKHQLRWQVATDVQIFNEAVAQDDADRAIDSYHGPLLQGLETDDAGEFSDWLEIAREELRSRWRALAISRLAATEPGDEHAAEGLLRRLLDSDPLDEEAVRTFLLAMARNGQMTAARAVYREFADRLERELGLEPTSETVAAFEGLQSLEPLRTPAVKPAVATRASSDRRRLPSPNTRFVGRERELAALTARLLTPECRVITVIGAGGVGKTRLALAAAQELAPEFTDGAALVPLDAITTVDDAAGTVATALGISLDGANGPQRLVAALNKMNVLLLLDNCEHLPELPGFVGTLSSAGSGVKVLATSRERLRLAEEQLFELSGLSYPTATEPFEAALKSETVTLFLDRARRVRSSFEFDRADGPLLVRLGEYTAGLPLAIELAAAWVRALPLRDLVESIGESLDLLRADTVDGIPRHASIRATFNQSWSTLGSAEQAVMRQLAVFVGPVSSSAAQFVAGASPVVLAALVDKSLLRLDDEGRYHRHPLLAAVTREKLAEAPAEHAKAVRRHTSYYLHFLRERTDRARGTQPATALAEIESEQVEILAAAESARQRRRFSRFVAIMRLLAVDTGYLLAKGFGPRRLELLRQAAVAAERAGATDSAHLLMGRLADAHGTHQGDARRALEYYDKAAHLAAQCGNTRRQIVYLSMAGAMASNLGDPGADDTLDMALSMAEESGDDLCLATVLEHRAYVYGRRGDYETSRELYDRSLRAAERLTTSEAAEPYEVRRLLYWGLLNLGEMELHLDRFELALETRARALEVAKSSGNPIWVAHAELELGEMHANAGDHETARAHLLRAQHHYRENHVTANLQRIESLLSDVAATGTGGGAKLVTTKSGQN